MSNDILALKAKREKVKRQKIKDYATDFDKFAEEQLQILTKDASKGFVKFRNNPSQAIVHTRIEEQKARTGKVRAIILKARQQGISTYVAGRSYWNTSSSPFTKTFVLAHDAATSDQLFDMTRNFISQQPELIRPNFSKSTGKELKYKDNNSSYRVGTAGSPEAGRGTTPGVLHGSEVAFWPHDEKVLAGLFQGVSSSAGTEIILESTANGAQGEFYRLYQDAKAGKNEYIAIFLPWHLTEEYATKTPIGFERTHEEDELVDKYKLSDEQVYWRRMKIAESGEVKFRQEYPITDDEAFLVSGSNVFSVDKLHAVVPSKPERVVEFDAITKQFEQCNGGGSLEIWKHAVHGQPYIIGADVALGVGQDHSAAVVMTPDMEIVAVYRNNRIDPGSYGDALYYLGRKYNNCLIVCESNSMGIATVTQLMNLDYPNLYHRTDSSASTTSAINKVGFKTTAATKPAIIAGLSRVILDEDITIPSNIILDELLSYLSLANGKTEAAPGKYDDTVIATALCIEGLRTHGANLSSTVDWSKFAKFTSHASDIKWF